MRILNLSMDNCNNAGESDKGFDAKYYGDEVTDLDISSKEGEIIKIK